MKRIGLTIATFTIVAALGVPAASASSSKGRVINGYYEPAGPVWDLPSRLEQNHVRGGKLIAM